MHSQLNTYTALRHKSLRMIVNRERTFTIHNFMHPDSLRVAHTLIKHKGKANYLFMNLNLLKTNCQFKSSSTKYDLRLQNDRLSDLPLKKIPT
jgi:hypothetical protein